jgi:hypothetical protein
LFVPRFTDSDRRHINIYYQACRNTAAKLYNIFQQSSCAEFAALKCSSIFYAYESGNQLTETSVRRRHLSVNITDFVYQRGEKERFRHAAHYSSAYQRNAMIMIMNQNSDTALENDCT